MTNNHLRHLSGILLAAAIFLAHPCPVFAQDSESRSPSSLRSRGVSLSAPRQAEKPTALTGHAVLAALPDAPMPQDQAENQASQDQTQDPPAPTPAAPETHLNRYPILSPGLTRSPLSVQNKFQIYIHKAYGPPAVILPAFGAGLGMLNPPSKYSKEWKDGAAAFGRNYGYRVADHTSRLTGQFLTGALLHEDPRYLRSTSSNPLFRTVHAIAFTIFDKTDSGRTTFAASNFASAAAGGFVGMGILPDGYNDVTHAEQHMASEFLQIGIGNVLTEFEPQWGPWAKKLRIPKILPGWWTPEHR
jgi:hypothetical protein